MKDSPPYSCSDRVITLFSESPERDGRELELRQSVYHMLGATRGYAARETIDAIGLAAALAERSGNLVQLGDWLRLRSLTALISGDSLTAGALADNALEVLREGTPVSLAEVYTLQVIVRYVQGELVAAEKHFTSGLEFFEDPAFKRNPAGGPVITFGHASWNAWMLGRADVARARMERMLAVANKNKPFQLAFAGYFAANLRLYFGEFVQAEALAARSVDLSEEYQLPYQAALARIVLGHARAELGAASEGVGLISKGIEALRKAGARAGRLPLVIAQFRQGAFVNSLQTAELSLQSNLDGHLHRPEILRLCGELRLKQGQPERAEAEFREAIALAQTMSAKSWELRATTSLARLLAILDRRDQARTMLADIYGWFTEGFDTADLNGAKALLDELGV